MLPNIPKSYQTEMIEIAKAANMSFDDILLINTFIDIATALAGRENELTPFVGVTFGFVNDVSTFDGPIIARNLDIRFARRVRSPKTIMYVIHPKEGKPFIYFSWPGMVGTLTGMNFGGLTITGNPVTGPLGMQKGIPYTIIIRDIVENRDDVPAAHQFLIACDLIGGNNIMITDTNDNLWLVECTPFTIAVKRANPNGGFNGRATYTLACQDIFSASILRQECLGIMPDNEQKTEILKTRLNNLSQKWGVEDMTKFASKLFTPMRTVLSVIFIPNKQRVWIWRDEGGESKYKEIRAPRSYGLLQPRILNNTIIK